MALLWSLRCRLIRMLAGKDMICINAMVSADEGLSMTNDQRGYISNVALYGIGITTRGAETLVERCTLEKPLQYEWLQPVSPADVTNPDCWRKR